MNKKDFKKEDLQNGMVVELRNGEKFMVLNNNITNEKDWIPLSGYKEFPAHSFKAELDIVKIYKSSCYLLNTIFNDDYLKLIWEHTEIEWNNIPVDTKLLVSDDGISWKREYFAKYKNGILYTWHNGQTSFSSYDNNNISSWKYAKLYKSQDE